MTTKATSPRILPPASPGKPRSRNGHSNENKPNVYSGSALMLPPGRAPLCPIPLPSQVGDGLGNGGSPAKLKTQATTPGGKPMLQPRSEIGYGTPEKKQLTGTTRNRFGWQQPRSHGGCGSGKDTCPFGFSLFSPNGKLGKESPCKLEGKEIQTPSKPSSEASNRCDNDGFLEMHCNVGTGRAASSNQSTPYSTKSTRSATSDVTCVGSIRLTGTPNRNVSRTLKYVSGSNSSSTSGATSVRPGFPTLRLGSNLSQHVRTTQSCVSDYQCEDVPCFKLEEDDLFWNDHNVQVLIRCRPLNASEKAADGFSRCLRQDTAHTLSYVGPPEARFTFDHVACEKITQEQLFQIAGRPMVNNCMSGYNSCMFAYGQTGSGKTYTMLGDIADLEQRPSDNRGMTPRIFEYLFDQILSEEKLRRDDHLKFTCKCSFLEIYNEQITDLLEPSATNLQMRDDVKKGVYVENLSEVEVKSVQDVVFLLLQGAANRRVAATNMNQESSRSHSVFTCIIESQWESEALTNFRFGRLNLVDLAGSERQKSSGANGERLKEAANINKSLSTLGLVIMILVDVAQGKQRHVPYRDSKLTFLLQDSLGGNSKTTIIANVSPSRSCASETLSTLRFAQRAKFIQNNAIVNEDAAGDVLALRLQIRQLKEELNRLSRQSISRVPLRNEGDGMFDLLNNESLCDFSVSVPSQFPVLSEKAVKDETCSRKVKAFEAVLAGSLRREKAIEKVAKCMRDEIERCNFLLKQREEEAQCNKMMLRFREDKIRRLEAIINGTLCGESWKADDKDALREELELLYSRLDKNPELTRFAMENIHLREQLERWQEFHDCGERDILLTEISDIRDQLSEYMEAKLAEDGYSIPVSDMEKELNTANPWAALVCVEPTTTLSMKPSLQEKEERIQWEAYRADELSRELEEARNRICSLEIQLKESRDSGKELAERLKLAQRGLIGAQEGTDAAQANVKQIRLETEQLILQQCQSFSEIQMAISSCQLQQWQERSQLEEVEDRIKKLAMPNKYGDLDESVDIKTQSLRSDAILVQHGTTECLIAEEQQFRREGENEGFLFETKLEQSSDTCNGLIAQLQEAEARIEKLLTDLDKRKEEKLKTFELLLQSSEDVKHYKLITESLENQLFLSVDKTKQMQELNEKIENALKRKEVDLKAVTECVVMLQSELERELEFKMLQIDEEKDNHYLDLKQKLERTTKALQQAEEFNAELQSEQNAFRALEEQKDLVRADAELETTEAITMLQSELVSVCEDHRIIQERELRAEQKVAKLESDLKSLRSQMEALSSENIHLKSLCQQTVAQKTLETSRLTGDWGSTPGTLFDCLLEGNQTLIKAAEEIDRCMEMCPSSKTMVSGTDRNAHKRPNALETLLCNAQKLAKQIEGKVRMENETFLTIADMQRDGKTSTQNELEVCQSRLAQQSHQLKNLSAQVRSWRAKAERNERNFIASCVVINKLSQTCLLVEILTRQKAQLEEALKESHQLAAGKAVEMEEHLLEYTSSMCSFLESLLGENIATVCEREVFAGEMCVLTEAFSVIESQFSRIKSHCHDELACLEEKCRAFGQMINRTDIKVQDFWDKLKNLSGEFQKLQAETFQCQHDNVELSKCLENIREESRFEDFAITLEMEIIMHVLMEGFREERLKLMFEVFEARNVSSELVKERAQNTERMQDFNAVIMKLKRDITDEQEISACLRKELTQSHKQLCSLKAQLEHAQLTCENLEKRSMFIQDDFSLSIFSLVLEVAFLKEFQMSQEAILLNELMGIKSTCSWFPMNIQEYSVQADSLTLVSMNFAEVMQSIVEAAQCCAAEYRGLISVLNPEGMNDQNHYGIVEAVFNDQCICQDMDCKTTFWENHQGLCVERQLRQIQNALAELEQGLKYCQDKVHMLCQERNQVLISKSQEDYVCQMLDIELKQCYCDLKGTQCTYLEMKELVEQSLELSRIAGKYVVKACCVLMLVKEEGWKQKRFSWEQSDLHMLLAELEKAWDTSNMMNEMLSCQHEELQQINCAPNSEQQNLVSLITSLHLKKDLLQEELRTRISDSLRLGSPSSLYCQCLDNSKHSSDQILDPCQSFCENIEMKVNMQWQMNDVNYVDHKLRNNCTLAYNIKDAQPKTVQVSLAKVAGKLNGKNAPICGLEQSHSHLQTQDYKLSHENQEFISQLNNLNRLQLLEVAQQKTMTLIDAVQIQEARILALFLNFGCLIDSNLVERRELELLEMSEAWHALLNNLETVIHASFQVTEGNSINQAFLNQMELALESQALRIKALDDKIVALEAEKYCLQMEKAKREITIKDLQCYSQPKETGAVFEAACTTSDNVGVVQGTKTNLPDLQKNIKRTAEWLSKEIGDDFKIVFTEGCAMVLNFVEAEVEACREQAEIAWKNFESVLGDKKELKQKLLKETQMVRLLESKVVALQNHTGVTKKMIDDDSSQQNDLLEQMQSKLNEKNLYVSMLENIVPQLQERCFLAKSREDEIEVYLLKQKESIHEMHNENVQLRSKVHNLLDLNELNEGDLAEKQHAIQLLKMQVETFKSLLDQEKGFSFDRINDDLRTALKERDLAIKERDKLHADLVVLNEQLEMAQQVAEEHEAVATEACQIAEASKMRAEEKEEEARLLERSVEELESTVNALETQVGFVRSETERQRIMKQDKEMDLQDFKHQMALMQAYKLDAEVLQFKYEQIKSRQLEEKQSELVEAEQKIGVLETKSDERNDQASIHSKPLDRGTVKQRGSISPFKCMGSRIAHQMSFEVDEELNEHRQMIEKLEALANSRQKEIYMLNVRLAEAESITHDVIRDLVGVKLDITNYVTSVCLYPRHKNVTNAAHPNDDLWHKEKELRCVKAKLSDLIEERESWLEEINRRQAEMMTARVAAEKLRLRDQLLSSENETLKKESLNQRTRISELLEEVNKLSGQQNLQQRIHHHAKIKEENNQLREKNEEITVKLRRSDILLNRVGEELARYREADGRTPYIDFEEEQTLRIKLEALEEEKIQIAQKLLTLCTSVLQVAGLPSCTLVDHNVAAEALKQLENRLLAADREISDMKLQRKMEFEKTRLSEMRSLHSPGPD